MEPLKTNFYIKNSRFYFAEASFKPDFFKKIMSISDKREIVDNESLKLSFSKKKVDQVIELIEVERETNFTGEYFALGTNFCFENLSMSFEKKLDCLKGEIANCKNKFSLFFRKSSCDPFIINDIFTYSKRKLILSLLVLKTNHFDEDYGLNYFLQSGRFEEIYEIDLKKGFIKKTPEIFWEEFYNNPNISLDIKDTFNELYAAYLKKQTAVEKYKNN